MSARVAIHQTRCSGRQFCQRGGHAGRCGQPVGRQQPRAEDDHASGDPAPAAAPIQLRVALAIEEQQRERDGYAQPLQWIKARAGRAREHARREDSHQRQQAGSGGLCVVVGWLGRFARRHFAAQPADPAAQQGDEERRTDEEDPPGLRVEARSGRCRHVPVRQLRRAKANRTAFNPNISSAAAGSSSSARGKRNSRRRYQSQLVHTTSIMAMPSRPEQGAVDVDFDAVGEDRQRFGHQLQVGEERPDHHAHHAEG